jgi:anaerobic selenocysteine-containing dehydrogenase
MMKLSRRQFLAGVGGVAAATATLRDLGQGVQTPRQLLEEWSNYEEEFHVSICQQCPGGCGILARVVDGNLVHIAGNPLYPVNEGGLCMKGLAGAQVLYDPDRLQSPLQRDGARGSRRWKAISWEEALQQVVTRLRDLRQGGKAHTVAVLGGQYRGLIDRMFQQFCQAYGTPNYLRLRCLEPDRSTPADYYTQGVEGPLAYDLAHSQYILSFGCGLLESWISTVHQQKAYGELHALPGGQRAQIVMVDPRYSVTAAKADIWLPLHPGTDAALALGLAYIIIQEGRFDPDFVRDHTFGFEDWNDASGTRHRGFRSLVLEDYSPEKVAAITGVPVERLFQVARGFAMNKPAIAIGQRGPSFHPNDLYTRMAIHSLNALVGSIGRTGGVVRQGTLPLAPWPTPKPDAAARAGLAQPRIDRPAGRPTLYAENGMTRLPHNIVTRDPYELNALFLYYANPLFSLPSGDDWAAALAKIPFIVSFSPFMDETTEQADLILPDCTYLERWRDDEVTHLAGITAFGIGEPVVPPLHNTRASEDVLLQIARGLGAPVADALPWQQHRDLLRDAAKGLYEAQKGHIVMPPQDEKFQAILARQGYWQQTFDTFDGFWEALVKRGAWWDPNDTFVGLYQLVKTPSHKFEFFSQLLQRDLKRAAHPVAGAAHADSAAALTQLAVTLGVEARGDDLFLPHFESAATPPATPAFPYLLNTYKLISLAGGKGANQPWLEQEPAVHLENGWGSWVEINPDTAAGLGIADGDWVWLEAARGRIKVQARTFAGAAPDVLNMPYGWGHRAYGHWARNRGQNPNDILDPRMDPLRGLPLWAGTRVRVVKA